MLSDIDLAEALAHNRPHRVFWYKFHVSLVSMIIRQLKFATWRLDWDGPIPEPGDHVYLCVSPGGQAFAFGVVGEVSVKRLGHLTEEDRHGHEIYATWEEMVGTFEGYYPKLAGKIGPATEVLIVKFHPILFAFDNDWHSGTRPDHTVYVEVNW
jgi:hypothetical protein